jgi:ABC-type branched-subunit amino acid transport system permease subunit
MAFSTTTLSPSSFIVIGALVAVAMTYLAGVSSISGALLAGALAQSGVVTTVANGWSGGSSGKYVFALSGVALIVTAIAAPEGLTGIWRARWAKAKLRFGR